MNDLCATREMTVEEAVQTIKNNTIYLMMGRSTHKEYDANRFIASINTLINYVEEQEIERKKKAIDALEGLMAEHFSKNGRDFTSSEREAIREAQSALGKEIKNKKDKECSCLTVDKINENYDHLVDTDFFKECEKAGKIFKDKEEE